MFKGKIEDNKQKFECLCCFEKYIFIHASRSTDIMKPPSKHAVYFEEERSVCIFYKELKKWYNESKKEYIQWSK